MRMLKDILKNFNNLKLPVNNSMSLFQEISFVGHNVKKKLLSPRFCES